jgi:hypothetical protein
MQALWDARCLHGTRTQTLATAFAAEDTHCLWMAAANHKTKQKLAPKLAPDWIKQCGTEWIRTAARLRLSPTKSGAIAQTSTSRDDDNRITGPVANSAQPPCGPEYQLLRKSWLVP